MFVGSRMNQLIRQTWYFCRRKCRFLNLPNKKLTKFSWFIKDNVCSKRGIVWRINAPMYSITSIWSGSLRDFNSLTEGQLRSMINEFNWRENFHKLGTNFVTQAEILLNLIVSLLLNANRIYFNSFGVVEELYVSCGNQTALVFSVS